MTNRLWEHPPLNSVFSDLMYVQHLPSAVVSHQLNISITINVLFFFPQSKFAFLTINNHNPIRWYWICALLQEVGSPW